jgi:TonB family protein
MEILEEPPAVFGEVSHGRVVLEARVDESGSIRSVKVTENTTGDLAFAALAEEDLRKFKFSPPVKRCKPAGFTYIYTRNF